MNFKKLFKRKERVDIKGLVEKVDKLNNEVFYSRYNTLNQSWANMMISCLGGEKTEKEPSRIDELREDIDLIMKYLKVEKEYKQCDKYVLSPIKKSKK